MSRCGARAALLALAVAALGCESTRPLSWVWELEPGLEATAVVETRVLEGGCEGAVIYEARVDRGGAGATPPELAPGVYGLAVSARDASCQVIGEACLEVTLPTSEVEARVTVAPVAPRPACAAGASCSEGRCGGEEPDAGPDPPDANLPDANLPDAARPDAGDCAGCFDGVECQPGDTASACGANGAACVPCGCDGDVCMAGVCVPAQPASSVAAARAHTCVVAESGRLYCWGDDSEGQLAANPSSAPGVADARSDWVEVSSEGTFTCGRRGSGGATVECWGSNSAGQLGRGTAGAPSDSPEALTTPIESATLGLAALLGLAVDAQGRLWCWGDNPHWGCAADAPAQISTPVQVGADTTWTQASGGIWTACGIRGGELLCWGWNADGEAGDGTSGNSVRSLRAIDAEGDAFVEVRAGIGHTCARRASGLVACWGCGGAECSDWIEGSCGPGDELFQADGDCSGKLGTGLAVSSSRPVNLSLRASALDTGGHSCAIDTEGALHCWGPNHDGQVGAGDTAAHLEPALIAPPRWSAVGVGHRHACAIREGGAVYCWGRNAEGQVGAAGDSTRPLRVCLSP